MKTKKKLSIANFFSDWPLRFLMACAGLLTICFVLFYWEWSFIFNFNLLIECPRILWWLQNEVLVVVFQIHEKQMVGCIDIDTRMKLLNLCVAARELHLNEGWRIQNGDSFTLLQIISIALGLAASSLNYFENTAPCISTPLKDSLNNLAS